MNFRKLITYLTMGTAAAMPLAVAQNPTILQGSYISNVFGNSNFIKNPNAQTNIADVTVSNATVTRSTTTPLVATSEFLVTVTSANGTIAWNTRTFDQGMKGQNCEARFTYRGFQSTSVAQVRQGATVAGANVVARLALTASTDPRIASINFPCGDLSQPTYFVITDTATLSGTHEIGGAYVGLATNMANVAQAEFVGDIKFTSCPAAWSLPSPTNFTSFNNQASACTVTTSGNVTNSSSGLRPEFGITSAKAGRYLITVNAGTIGSYKASSLAAAAFFRLFDGTNGISEEPYSSIEGASATIAQYMSWRTFNVEFTGAVTNKTISIQAKSTDTAALINAPLTITVYRFPSSSELVVKPETQSWFIDGYHTGNNPSLGTTAVATRTEITNGTMTFTPKTGSAPVATLCSSTNSPPALSTATTSCAAGNESMGITFNIPTAGIYKVCSEFQPNINVAAASEVDLYMFLEETATNANTALTTNRSVNRYFTATSTANNMTTPIRMCENFNFASVGQKAIRLMYQQTVAGTVNSAVIVADNYKERGIKWTVEPYDNQSNSALYVQGPVLGAQTGAAISASYVGEVLSADDGASINTTSATYNVLSLALTPGVWDVQGKCLFNRNSATITTANWIGAITNQNSNPADSMISWLSGTAFVNIDAIAIPTETVRVRWDGTTNITPGSSNTSSNLVYIRCYPSTFTGGPVTVWRKIWARRVN